MKNFIWIILSLLVASFLLASCAPVHTDPLEGIVNWSRLPEAPVSKPFNQASFGLILSDNVEKEIHYYQTYMKFWGWMDNERTNNNYNLSTGVQKTVAMLKQTFKTSVLVNDMNECQQSKLDYCGVLDIERQEKELLGVLNEIFQLFLMNGKGGRVAAIKAESGWHSYGSSQNLEGVEQLEEEVMSKMEAELQRVSH